MNSVLHCYETQSLITVITKAHHWTLSSANLIQFTHLQLVSFTSFSIISFRLCHCLSKVVSSHGIFQSEILYLFLVSSMHALYVILLSHLHLIIPNSVKLKVQIVKHLSLKFSLFLCHLIFHRSKYAPQHFVFKHLQCVSSSEFYKINGKNTKYFFQVLLKNKHKY